MYRQYPPLSFRWRPTLSPRWLAGAESGHARLAGDRSHDRSRPGRCGHHRPFRVAEGGQRLHDRARRALAVRRVAGRKRPWTDHDQRHAERAAGERESRARHQAPRAAGLRCHDAHRRGRSHDSRTSEPPRSVTSWRHSQAGRHHGLVADIRKPSEVYIRGMFSATQIARQLGMPVQISELAQTFAEVEQVLHESH